LSACGVVCALRRAWTVAKLTRASADNAEGRQRAIAQTTRGALTYASALTLSRISRSAGNRPSSFLEKTLFPSMLTTKIPPLPRTIWLSMPNSRLIAAARLEALGR
jgi:hypothetical protein